MVSDPPLILAFDTSAAHCAAALLRGDQILAARVEPMQRGQAERLIPMLDEILAEGGASYADLTALAVCEGPGNFTGLRLGIATARGLGLALGIPAIGVTLFDALAYDNPGPLLICLEDRRGEVFSQSFAEGAPSGPARMTDIADLAPLAPDTRVLGFRAAEIAARFSRVAGPEAVTVDPATLARVAATRLDGPTIPRPAPLYLRHADAAPSSEPATVLLDDA